MARKKKVEEGSKTTAVTKNNVWVLILAMFILSIIGGFINYKIQEFADTSDKHIEPKILECNMNNYDFGLDYFIKPDNDFMLDKDNIIMCCVILNRIARVCDGDCQVACQLVKVE